jgi:23S rRNA (pseudouridine1915-N3)-methyltransferase
MPRGYEIERVTLRPGAKEAERILAAVPRGARIVALDERGRDLTTAGFAPLLNQESAFLIGGADGLDAGIKKEAALLLRLSSFTLAHALAQVVLMEQLYRAATLLVGHPYHRE